MNFLFATVLVLLLVAPGLSFFRAYYAGRFSIRYSRLTITDQIFRSIVPGITVQVLCIVLINSCTSYHVHVEVLGVLLMGAKDDTTLQKSFELINESLPLVALYHIFMVGTGAFLGWQARRLVRRKKFDRRYSWLRFDNKWFYLLSGEIVEFQDRTPIASFSDARLIEFVVVDILTEIEDGNVIYTGILVDYELENDGGLRSVQIKGAKRKSFKTSTTQVPDNTLEGSSEMYYDVSGDILIIHAAQIININISYWLNQESPGLDHEVEIEERE